MLKTIFTVMGILFSIVFFGIMLRVVDNAGKDFADGGRFIEIQTTKNGSNLIVSWSTDRETDGVLHYHYLGSDSVRRSTEFSYIHQIVLESMSGEVEFYIDACDLTGGCIISPKKTVAMP